MRGSLLMRLAWVTKQHMMEIAPINSPLPETSLLIVIARRIGDLGSGVGIAESSVKVLL